MQANTQANLMEFKHEQLIDRELVIARLLVQGCSLKEISEITGLSKKIAAAHIHNMKVKLQIKDATAMIGRLKNIIHNH